MSNNVRTIRDRDFDANPPRRLEEGFDAIGIPLTMRDTGGCAPRDENFLQMFKNSCCPSLKWVSFTTFISLVDILIFIVTLCLGGISSGNPATPPQFLQVSPVILFDFGERYPFYMRYDWQEWRFITPVFLHAYFLHIFFNMVSQLIFGAMLENKIPQLQLMLFYFVGGFGGNLFGALVSDTPAVGASTAIAALLGIYLAYIIVNWNRFEAHGMANVRDMMLCYALMLIMFEIMFGMTMSGDGVDNWGHLGGLITGIFSGMWLITPMDNVVETFEKTVSRVGWCVLAFYFVLGVTLFFTVRHPSI
jgi:rhomboid protease GluP